MTARRQRLNCSACRPRARLLRSPWSAQKEWLATHRSATVATRDQRGRLEISTLSRRLARCHSGATRRSAHTARHRPGERAHGAAYDGSDQGAGQPARGGAFCHRAAASRREQAQGNYRKASHMHVPDQICRCVRIFAQRYSVRRGTADALIQVKGRAKLWANGEGPVPIVWLVWQADRTGRRS